MILGFGDPLFYFYLIYFFIAIFIAFFIPGNLVLRRTSLSFFSRITLSPIIGLVLWIYQGLIFGYLQIRWASYFYILLSFLIWVFIYRKNVSKLKTLFKKLLFAKKDKLLLLIIIAGSLIQISTVWFHGYRTSAGFNFYGLFPDSFYNLALTSSLIRNFPPFEPGANNIVVHNYHYLSNLAVADLVRVFGLPLIQSNYQYVSIFLSVYLGLLGISFSKELNLDIAFKRWLLFFLYFSGDIIFVLFLNKSLNFNVNLPEKATSLWVSPPRVYAMVVLFAGLVIFVCWLKDKSFYSGVLTALVFACLIGLKVYIGIFVLAGLGIIGFFYLVKRNIRAIIPLLLYLIITLLLYLPVNADAGGLVFSGLWRIENFAVSSQLGLDRIELARIIYLNSGNYLKVALIEGVYLLLYIYSLFGMFLIGFIQSKRSLSIIPKTVHMLLLGGFVASLIFGLFFLQTSGGANTSQFLFSVYIVGSIYSSLSLSFWIKKIKRSQVKIVVTLIIAIFISARVIHDEYKNIGNILDHKNFATISNEQLAGINYLSKNTKDDDIIAVDSELSANDYCYHLIFMTNRRFFLCGEGILNDHAVNIEEKIRVENVIFKSKDTAFVVKNELRKNRIDYILTTTGYNFPTEKIKNLFIKVFSNTEYKIYKVNK